MLGGQRQGDNVVYLDFSKVIDSVSHNIIIRKLTKFRLNKWTVRWIESWVNDWAQRAVISGTEYSWRQV